MGAKTINDVIKNPFFTSKIIYNFVAGYNKDFDYRILYLVLPIVLDGYCREKLNGARKNSTIYSIFSSSKKYFDKINLDSKIDLYNIYSNKEELISITNKSLIILYSKNILGITKSKDIFINRGLDDFQKCKDAGEKRYLKAAYYFGVILSKNSLDEFLELVKGV